MAGCSMLKLMSLKKQKRIVILLKIIQIKSNEYINNIKMRMRINCTFSAPIIQPDNTPYILGVSNLKTVCQ